MSHIIQVFLVSLITFNSVHAQLKLEGNIIYSTILNDDEIKKSLENNRLFKNRDNVLKSLMGNVSINYILNFNNTESIFFQENKMNNEGRKENKTLLEILAGDGIFYTEKQKLILHQKESFGEMFLIAYPKIQWNLTQDVKKIGNYICYKATAIKVIKNKNGEVKRQIIAWYSPEIPIDFGPKEFSGLPGLVLKLQEGKLTFTATSINLNLEQDIKKLEKGKKITLEEHYKLMQKMTTNFYKEIGGN